MPKPHFQKHDTIISEMVRVNQAGEFGAKQIYAGQLRFMPTGKDRDLVVQMLKNEMEHLDYFNNKLQETGTRPTLLSPLWKVGGYALGALSALIGKKTAMLATEAVEEVISDHYQDQINYLSHTLQDTELLANISKFKDDEDHHRNTAIVNGSKLSPFYKSFHRCITNICKFAIFLSKKI